MELISAPKKSHTKYLSEYCEQVRKHMSRGYSFEAFASDIGVDRQTLYNWCAAYPEFKQAKDIGTEASRKKIEGLILRNAKTGKGSAISLIFMLKNKFPNDWRDRKEVDLVKEEVKETLTLDEQLAKVELMRAQLLQIKASQDSKVIELGKG